MADHAGPAEPVPDAGAGTTAGEPAQDRLTVVPAPLRQPSLKPAMIVIGLVAFIFVVFLGLELITQGSSGKLITGPPVGHALADGLVPLSAKAALAPITTGGLPPDDIIGALVVPKGTRVTGKDNLGAGLSGYDQRVDATVPDAPSTVVNFYKTELRAYHWSIVSDTTIDGRQAIELLAKLGSSDGYYWEVGIVAKTHTVLITPALAGSSQPAGPTTILELSLYEVPSPD